MQKKMLLIIFISICTTPFINAAGNLITKGDKAYKKFKNAEAYQSYQQAYKKDKKNFTALKMMVSTLNNLGEEAKAESGLKVDKHANECIKMNPKSALAFVTLGVYYREIAKQKIKELK